MQRQRLTRLEKRASSALDVTVGTAASCSPMTISWDASKGKAPWTVMIAPINQTPSIISIPDASGSNASYDWSVPQFTSTTDAFVAVSDSTGAVSGVASQISIHTSQSTCDVPASSLDFIWFPTGTASLPAECTDWGISWGTDDGNNGIQGDVTFTFLPENGVPLTVSTSSGKSTSKSGSFDFTIPWNSGTKFAAIANDGGKSGTGGVGDLYSVTAGKSTSCPVANSLANGLPPAQSTGSAKTASSTTKASSNATATSKSSSTNTAKQAGGSPSAPQFTQGSTAADGSSTSKHSSTGAAVGGTFAALAIIGLLLGLFWYWRKKSRQSENPFEKEAEQQHGISPWRWSSSPYEQPVTNSRASKWLGRASNIVPTPAKGFRIMGDQSNHSTGDNSFSTSVKGAYSSAHARNTSSISSPISPKIASANNAFRNVVPDAALFPPPKPISNDDRNHMQILPYTGGTGRPGQNAGVGTYESMTKQDSISQYSTSPQGATFVSHKEGYSPMPQIGGIWHDPRKPTHEIQLGNNQPHVTNEVMMQTFNRSDHKRQSQQSDEGLPYL